MINIKTMKKWKEFNNELKSEIKEIRGFRFASIKRYTETSIGIEGGAVLVLYDFKDSVELEMKSTTRAYSGEVIRMTDLRKLEKILWRYTHILEDGVFGDKN